MDRAKHIKIEYHSVTYPIGNNIPNLMRLIDLYLDAFNTHITLPEGTNINLWCRGSSGAIIAGIFASKLKNISQEYIRISHVKKHGEDSHSITKFSITNAYNIVIDDFVSTGETVKAIFSHMRKFAKVEIADLLIVASGGYGGFVDEKMFKTIISNS